MTTFPVAEGHYYGVDYGSRPPRDADLRWYRNIPVPTSYMCMGTEKDFFGGYDHAAGEGYVHWADHSISPGKKLWTWGDHEFGYAWDRELTDADEPYAELMAGVFTDNQPDFARFDGGPKALSAASAQAEARAALSESSPQPGCRASHPAAVAAPTIAPASSRGRNFHTL